MKKLCLACTSVLLSFFAQADTFSSSGLLALQIALDRRGFSCNTIDGAWGRKSEVALATYCSVRETSVPPNVQTPLGAKVAFQKLFPNEPPLFKTVIITPEDRKALTLIPDNPTEKAALPAMGFETLAECFAERGHLSQIALKRLNPTLNWPNPPVGTQVTIPDFGADDGRVLRNHDTKERRVCSVLRVSLSRYEITCFDEDSKFIALFPCSIAASKSKLPPAGEIQVKTLVPNPNYTYTPDYVRAGARVVRHLYPPGPNNPVGMAWIGLSLSGYGIHGTPTPERIGRAESHGCFRLANWNAQRLMSICDIGVSVVIEE